MPFKDLREFIARLETTGELQRVDEEVDWNLEAGALLRRVCEERLPALLFQKIKSYPPGYSIVGGILGNYKRLAMALDLEPGTSAGQLMGEYSTRKKRLIKPLLVSDGPCKENIHIGEEANLLEFPVPMVHFGDGGRYFGTWHVTINKDLDSDWANWGMYRHMLHNRNTLGIMSGAHQHLGFVFHRKYEPRNKVMEVAIAVGVDPGLTMCAGAFLPFGVSEAEVAGGLRGESVELVRCETVDLAVPATAEIVVEGEMRPHETMDEGPFGEFAGYMASERTPKPVIHVRAITHRNNPVFTMCCLGIPMNDEDILMSMIKGGELLEALQARGMPVKGLCVSPEASHLLAVIAVDPPYANVADDIAHIAWGTKAGRSVPYLVIVNSDVDPFNLPQVFHALATKCHPYRGITNIEHATGIALFPWATPYEKKHGMGARAYFDCTWPLDWEPSEVPPRVSFSETYPAEVQAKALAILKKYGY